MGSTRRRDSDIPAPSNPDSTCTTVRWTVACILVTCAVLVLILPWPLPYEQSIEDIMQERASHLHEQCETIPTLGNFSLPAPRTDNPNHPYYNYFLEPRHRLLWCAISKVASTSWMYQLNRWADVPQEKIAFYARDLKALTRLYYPTPTRADVEQIKRDVETPVVRFLLVRDPFDRFVSAYEDLIVRPQSDNYRNLRRFIFREVYGVDVPVAVVQNATSPAPSFSDFTEFVLRRKNVRDPHWESYYNLCDPCFLQPTVIVKLETYDRDVAHLLQLLNHTTTGTGRYDNARLNVNHHRTANNDASMGRSKSTLDRLAELTGDQFERLYHRYELDFRLFQYDASQYFALFRED
ncbi:carbohydrate sulfotransferase 11-like [Anopheles nili]|uniref:carbohydrate sulfotransferase 11-like n=1 Tax=Anopheles nili TaxID=185578 RepID=UPI00237AC995|nr:carbohydrate sulfotransferase 11-like [Anopheles nili]